MEQTVVDKPHDRPTVAAWLKTQMDLTPASRIRLEPAVMPDRRVFPVAGGQPAELEAWTNGAWWFSRMGVEIYYALMPIGKQPRWLLLGSAHVAGIVEGQKPGESFVSCWEDQASTWLDLAHAAANEAAETLDALDGVGVEWRSADASSSPAVSSES